MGYLDSTGLSHLWGKIKTALSGKASFEVTSPENMTNFYIECRGLVYEGYGVYLPVIIYTDSFDYMFTALAYAKIVNGALDTFRIDSVTSFAPEGILGSSSGVNDDFKVRAQYFASTNLASTVSATANLTQLSGNLDLYYLEMNQVYVSGVSYKRKNYKIS